MSIAKAMPKRLFSCMYKNTCESMGFCKLDSFLGQYCMVPHKSIMFTANWLISLHRYTGILDMQYLWSHFQVSECIFILIFLQREILL